ncbi:conserved hypothetical protein [Nitrosopumilaceae archaeon]|nr:MarR family winged helix-turn-helix transcriptional regulator [Nitrosopumilus sp.]CAI9831503.1 conserved hypothetical protein [Nitrosopumilaceae archaeon]MDA7944594.1 MarR family winged helix-turn-helix transcriptional regulator [Nitrosopumilus sp.]MDA7953901.1 MarR family winged helix-turn-helix transcriptional regulator [Nitrosopumilus sp.]MDA7973274.1 MarR family winged helix-turn-helix transcriptional regulator [Nitrosopumilus sp.]
MNPEELMVLGAISRRITRFEKIQRETGVDPKELDAILQRLEGQGLIRVEEKKGWLGRKIEMHPTEDGFRRVEEGARDLQESWGKMASLYKDGKKGKLKQMMDDNRSILPAMMFFGVMDMAMFGLMFGMIGSSMSDYVPGADAGAGEDAAQDAGQDADAGDPGGFDFDVGF